jgi:N4-gp56 family major capsid protein
MAVGTSTSSQIPAPVRVFYNRLLLDRALPFLAHGLFGQQYPVDMNSGDQPRWRRYTALPQAAAPLVEGVTPASQQLAKTDVTGQLVQYGQYVTITDYVDMTSQDRVITEAVELLGESAGQTLDGIYRDTLVAGSNVLYTNGTARTAVSVIIAASHLNKLIRAMRNNNAKYWRQNPIVGRDRVGTAPISASYFAIVDPEMWFTIRGLTGVKQTHEYADPGQAMPGEVGAFNQLRFIETTEAKVFAGGGNGTTASTTIAVTGTAADVHALLAFGQDAYGITPLGGKNFETIVKPRGAGDDPLNQRSTAGWKANTDIAILNDAFMYRLECAVSA